MGAEVRTEKETEEYVRVHTPVVYKNWDSAGKYLSICLNRMKENGEMWASRCPECKRVLFPPIITCGYCKIRIENKDENWVKLGDKGTVLSFFTPGERARDRSTGQLAGSGQTMAYIRPDGGDEYTIIAHILENIDKSKVYKGMRVQAVWKPKEERRGRMSDVLYYVPVEDVK